MNEKSSWEGCITYCTITWKLVSFEIFTAATVSEARSSFMLTVLRVDEGVEFLVYPPAADPSLNKNSTNYCRNFGGKESVQFTAGVLSRWLVNPGVALTDHKAPGCQIVFQFLMSFV